MLLSRSGEYALLAMLLLAEQPEGDPLRGSDIARALDVPANSLSKLLHQLARAGVLRSTRGPRGGFRLAKPAGDLRLSEALAPIEAARLGRRCLLGRAECRDDAPCAAHDQWSALASHIDRFLGETTLASLRSQEPGTRRPRERGRKKRRCKR
jgi:Rrf2 family iron-sulfur cluster assembly transcriptional regulator